MEHTPAYDSMERKDWFVIDTEDYMKEHIAAHGFTMLAIAEDGNQMDPAMPIRETIIIHASPWHLVSYSSRHLTV